MRCLLSISLLLVFFNSLAQFESEIDSLKKEGAFYLGKLQTDSNAAHTIYLPKDVDLKFIKNFYVTLETNDTITECSSGGGQHNFLWTFGIDKTLYDKSNNKSYFLTRIFWEYREERFKNGTKYVGTFFVRFYDKRNQKLLKNVSFTLKVSDV